MKTIKTKLKTGAFEWRNEAGQLHRERDLPAVVFPNGTKRWYQHGNLHRVGKPAFIWNNGNIEWYEHGLRHCETGPAKIYPGRIVEWYLFDTKYKEEDFLIMVEKINLHKNLTHDLKPLPIIKRPKI